MVHRAAPRARDGLGDCDPRPAAVWIPPTGTDECEHSLFDDQRVAEVAADMERYARFWSWVSEHQHREPVWHLDSVAGDSSSRGRGLGAALIDHGLAFARPDDLRAALETGNPRNVPYYEPHGFRVAEAMAAPDGGPTVRFMRTDLGQGAPGRRIDRCPDTT